jgi:transcription antitermination factor NusA-like protein
MRLRLITIVGLILLTATAMLGHGNKKHVIGTLEKINNDSVVVKTADGKSVEVKLVPSTMYVAADGKEGKAAKLSDLAVGERVVIHATPKGEALLADEVKFSAPGSKAAATNH